MMSRASCCLTCGWSYPPNESSSQTTERGQTDRQTDRLPGSRPTSTRCILPGHSLCRAPIFHLPRLCNNRAAGLGPASAGISRGLIKTPSAGLRPRVWSDSAGVGWPENCTSNATPPPAPAGADAADRGASLWAPAPQGALTPPTPARSCGLQGVWGRCQAKTHRHGTRVHYVPAATSFRVGLRRPAVTSRRATRNFHRLRKGAGDVRCT